MPGKKLMNMKKVDLNILKEVGTKETILLRNSKQEIEGSN